MNNPLLTLTPEQLAEGMELAILTARTHLGMTWPNPSVGAALFTLYGFRPVATHATEKAGKWHAERGLILKTKPVGEETVLFSVLEPCSHHGRTPPCVHAILGIRDEKNSLEIPNHQIKIVVVGCRDPHKIAAGGNDELAKHGVIVIDSAEEIRHHAELSQASFRYSVENDNRPFVTIKRAFRQAANSEWTMLPQDGQTTFTRLIFPHLLRKKAGAIITTVPTIMADNPSFTVRDPVEDHLDTVRDLIIVTRKGEAALPDVVKEYIRQKKQSLAATHNLRGLNPVVVTSIDAAMEYAQKREDASGKSSPIRDILVEAGPMFTSALIASGHWTVMADIQMPNSGSEEIHFTFNQKVFTGEKQPFDPLYFDPAYWVPTMAEDRDNIRFSKVSRHQSNVYGYELV